MKRFIILLVVSQCILWAQDISLKAVFSESNPPFSYNGKSNTPEGIIPELMTLLTDELEKVNIEQNAQPWSRAQNMMKTGEMDLFCTYPSTDRKNYALFTKAPLFYLENDYLIFSKQNSKFQDLLKIKNMEDLNNFTLVSHSATGWEKDNIPESVNRIIVHKHEYKFNIIFKRQAADFFIMNLEEAIYIAKEYGYLNDLAYIQVDFIKDSEIPFHIGIRKSHEQSTEIINKIDETLNDIEFIDKLNSTIKEYR